MPVPKVAILWAEPTSYLEATIRSLITMYAAEVSLVYWDIRGNTSGLHDLSDIDGLTPVPRSSVDRGSLNSFLTSWDPDIVVVSGWMDQAYLHAIGQWRKTQHRSVVVAGIDDQWRGTFRQRLGASYFKHRLAWLFDYFWVSGSPQFAYSQRFGVPTNRIIYNLYSADVERIMVTTEAKNRSAHPFPKRFLFVGRFVAEKNVTELAEAYCSLSFATRAQWGMVFVGDGPLREPLLRYNSQGVVVSPFLQPRQLDAELASGGVGCLVSGFEQWGVVIHEFASAGMPIFASTSCGAASDFLIHGFNGISISGCDQQSIKRGLMDFTQMADGDLHLMGARSLKLAPRITPELSAASLMSVFPSYRAQLNAGESQG